MWKKKGGLDRKRESELDFGTGVIAREEEGGGEGKSGQLAERSRKIFSKKKKDDRERDREREFSRLIENTY